MYLHKKNKLSKCRGSKVTDVTENVTYPHTRVVIFTPGNGILHWNKPMPVDNSRSSSKVNTISHSSCTRCDEQFATKRTLNSHMQLHMGQFQYYREQCRGVLYCPDFGCFVSSRFQHLHCIAMRNSIKAGVNRHKIQEIEHTTGRDTLVWHRINCEYCPETFTTIQMRDYHQSVHTGLYHFNCNVCNKGFNKKRVYEQYSNYHA